MPSQRAILANIHELNLDPKKAHMKLSKKGSLVLESDKIFQDKKVLAAIPNVEEETLELTQEQQQELLEIATEQVTEPPVLQPAEKKNKKGNQKKSN